jgi:hypothetical protein
MVVGARITSFSSVCGSVGQLVVVAKFIPVFYVKVKIKPITFLRPVRILMHQTVQEHLSVTVVIRAHNERRQGHHLVAKTGNEFLVPVGVGRYIIPIGTFSPGFGRQI